MADELLSHKRIDRGTHPDTYDLVRYIRYGSSADGAGLTSNEDTPNARQATSNVYFIHMKVRDIIKALEAAGWREVSARGGHRQLKHPNHPGRVTVPFHKGDMPIGTLRSIEKQAGIKLGG